MSDLKDKITQVKEDIINTRDIKVKKLVPSISSRFIGNYDLERSYNPRNIEHFLELV
jgi:hypothetical protein